jgi:probable rRNA maturation factor
MGEMTVRSDRTAHDMIEVEIADNQDRLELDQAWLTSLIEHALREENINNARLSVALVDNRAIHKINQQFLQHDFPTDVITFPLSDGRDPLVGEIVISTEYAIDSSTEFQWPARIEVGLYVVHGVLHLCGYDDHDEKQAGVMHQRQHAILQRFLQFRNEPSSYPSFQSPAGRHDEREPCH